MTLYTILLIRGASGGRVVWGRKTARRVTFTSRELDLTEDWFTAHETN